LNWGKFLPHLLCSSTKYFFNLPEILLQAQQAPMVAASYSSPPHRNLRLSCGYDVPHILVKGGPVLVILRLRLPMTYPTIISRLSLSLSNLLIILSFISCHLCSTPPYITDHGSTITHDTFLPMKLLTDA